jgi:hypothetical protein
MTTDNENKRSITETGLLIITLALALVSVLLAVTNTTQAKQLTENTEKEIIVYNYTYNNTVNIAESTVTNHHEEYYYAHEKSQQCKGQTIKNMIETIGPQGNSMLPAIDHTNKLLVVQYKQSTPLVAGDIVFVNNRFTHRIVVVYDEYVITKGDNNEEADEIVYKEEITHVVCGIMRN